MRRSASEKLEIIRLVEDSELSVRQTLAEMQIPPSTFYAWYRRYQEGGLSGLADQKPVAKHRWNRIPEDVREDLVEYALEHTELSARELAHAYTEEKRYFVSEASYYRLLRSRALITSPAYILMSASDSFKNPSNRVHELWQTDFTYFKIVGWGWYYLSTVLDDFSRYIIAWTLSPSMNAADARRTIEMALDKSRITNRPATQKPRILSDNGSAYVSNELRSYLSARGIKHTRGAPYHPMTQGKIERWHRTMKNVVKLEHYYFPKDLEQAIGAFVDYYNNKRYHEALDNVRPVDVYLGRKSEVLEFRQRIKNKTLKLRRKQNQAEKAA